MHTSNAINQQLSNEWYTPYDPWIKNVQILYGGQIGLDPCSNKIAQQWINAKVYWTINTPISPLNRHWGSKKKPNSVWFNPPYCGEMPYWVNHMIGQWELKHIEQITVLIRGDSQALRDLQDLAGLWCEPKRRIRFILPNGEVSKKPIPGYRLFYLGENKDEFADLFSPHGLICTKYR